MSFKTMGRASLALCFACLLWLCAAPAWAQETASVVGTVTDATGAIIPGATVTLTNTGTNVVRTTTTQSTGDFDFALLQVGTYSVKVEAKGFRTYTVPSIALSAGDRFRADAKLQVGEASQTVEVSGAVAPALQTDTSNIGSLVPSQSVEDLPLNGRNLVKLVQLTPGITEGSPGSIIQGNRPDDRRQTSSFSANGQTDTMNQNMVDGMDNNERIIGTIGVRPSIDAVQEVSIQTNKYDASVGRTGGAVVDVITKSGTNGLHGSVYEFFRNKVLNTNPNYNFTLADNPVGDTIKGYDKCPTAASCQAAPNPVFRQNQFGGSLGGPIKKDKTFFFADWEHLGYAYAPFGQVTYNVPTLCERGSAMAAAQGYTGSLNCPGGENPTTPGDFTDIFPVSKVGGSNSQDTIPGVNLSDAGPKAMSVPTCGANPTPGTCLSTVGIAYMSMYPLPNTGTADATTSNYHSTPVKTFTSDTWDARVDQHFSDRNTLYGRYTHNGETTLNPNGFPNVKINPATGLPSSSGVLVDPVVTSYAGPNTETQDQTTVSFLHVFNPNLVVNLKLGVFRSNIQSYPANNNTFVTNALGIPCDASACVNAGHINPSVVGSGLASVSISGLNGGNNYTTIGDTSFIPLLEYDTSFQYLGTVTWTHGAHSVRFGATLIRRRATIGQSSNSQGTFTFNGSYTGVAMGDVLEGLETQFSRSNALRQPGFRSWEPSAYVQDDWRARPWLTLNLGLRYDIFTPYTEVHGRISQYNPYTGMLMSPAIPGTDQSPTVGVPTPYTDIAPRFGFAATLKHNMVLRGGFGLTFFPVNYESPYYFNNPPFSYASGNCQIENETNSAHVCGNIGGTGGTDGAYPVAGAQYNGAPGQFGSGAVANYGTCPYTGTGNTCTGPGPKPALSGSTVYCASCATYASTLGGGDGGLGGPFFNLGLPTPVLKIENATNTALYAGQSFQGVPPFITKENMLEQFNLELQKQFGANVVSLGYVGQIGRHISPLNSSTGQNTAANPTQQAPGNATLPMVTGGQSAYGYGTLPGYPWMANNVQVVEEGALGTSVYNAMQATLVRRFNNGLTINLGYTWSHILDNVPGPRGCVASMFGPYEPCFVDEANGLGPSLAYQSSSFPLVTSCAAEGDKVCKNVFGWQHTDWGNDGQNVPQRITWQVNYTLPFAKSATGFEHMVLGGWSLNSQGSHQSGLPYGVNATVYDQTCNANNVPANVYPGIPGKGILMWFNPNCFVAATPGTRGNEHPNQFTGPGLNRFDFSVFKTFALNERFKLQFRAEAFNLFNTPMFNTPGTGITFKGSTINGSATAPPVQIDATHLPGEITAMNANWNQRLIQLALKLNF
ncbi:MAG: carboxypeptidase regulatory-like domain-containing protein [Candidatus Acidiferrales bacterium]